MQVSWIEPEQLRDLVGQIQSPVAKAGNVAWELHTLPNPAGLGARELGIEEGDLWLPDGQGDAAQPPPPPVAPPVEQLFASTVVVNEPPLEATPPPFAVESAPSPAVEEVAEPPPPAQQPKELDRIRERLQAIRVRAIEAGLLAHVGVTSEVRMPVQAPEMETAMPAVSSPPAEVTVDHLLPVASPFSLAEPAAPAPEVVDSSAFVSAFEPPSGSLADRLNAFAAWAGSELGVGDLLVVDDHGDVLWGFHEQASLVVSAMMACKAAMRSSALGAAGLSGVIEQPVSAGRMLVIVPCQTGYGTLSIAFVRDGGLSASDAQMLQSALAMTIETRSDAGFESGHQGSSLE